MTLKSQRRPEDESDVVSIVEPVFDGFQVPLDGFGGQEVFDIQKKDVDADVAENSSQGDHIDINLAAEFGEGDVLEPIQSPLCALDRAFEGFCVAEALVDDEGLGREPLPGSGEFDQHVGFVDDRVLDLLVGIDEVCADRPAPHGSIIIEVKRDFVSELGKDRGQGEGEELDALAGLADNLDLLLPGQSFPIADELEDILDLESEHAFFDKHSFFEPQLGREIEEFVVLGISVHFDLGESFSEELLFGMAQKNSDRSFAPEFLQAVDPVDGEDELKHPAVEESDDDALCLDDIQERVFVLAKLPEGVLGEVGLQNPPNLIRFPGVDFIDEKAHQPVDRLAVLGISLPDQHFSPLPAHDFLGAHPASG